jgi:hypothetical protein
VALRALVLVLFLASALGLTGAPAMARMAPAQTAASAGAMADDCPEMMADHRQPKKSPCDGTLHCMLAMGCLSLNLVPEADDAAVTGLSAPAPEYWPAVATLHGTSSPPDTDPPTRLG